MFRSCPLIPTPDISERLDAGASRKSRSACRSPRTRQAARQSCEHTPAASRCRAPPDADSRRGTPPRKRDTAKANRPFCQPFLRLKAALPAACGLPSGEDGRGRESRIAALARASGRAATAARGRLFCFGNERAKPLAFPPKDQTEAAASLPAQALQRRRPRSGATQPAAWRRAERTTRLLRAAQRRSEASARPSAAGKERGESASGSAQKRRALRSARRGTERVHKKSRSICAPLPRCAPDRHRKGQNYRLGARSA